MAVLDALLIHLDLQDVESRLALGSAVEALRDAASSLGLDVERVHSALAEIWEDARLHAAPADQPELARLLGWADDLCSTPLR